MRIRGMMTCFLCAALCASAAGCAADTKTAEAPAATAAVVMPAAEAARDVPARGADTDAADKEETVYVQADPDGTARKVTVETVLNYAGTDGVIEDVTVLRDIKNTEGDEEFTEGGNGALTWEDHGEPIRYEGVSDREPPVAVHITYTLDGKETLPEDLAGKSGHLAVRFDYENRTEQTVTVTHADLSDEDDEDPAPPETEDVVIPVPFLAISLAMLPDDVFRNVRAENARLVTLGDSVVVMGTALPGLREALDLTSVELTEDIEIPSYVAFEADVTDLSIDFTATILSNGLLKDLETEDLDDIEKMTDGIDRLTEASEKLVDGTEELADGAGELADGAGEFAGYFRQYVSGVSQAGEGAQTLRDGVSAMDEQSAPLREAAASAAEEIARLRETLNGMDIPEMDSTADALDSVIASIDKLQSALTLLREYPAAVSAAVGSADSLLAGVDLDVSAALGGLDLTDAQQRAVYDAVTEQLAGAQGSIDAARGCLAQLPDAAAMPDLPADAETLSQTASQLRAMAQDAQTKLDELPESPNEALDGLAALTMGVEALCEGVGQLSEGVAALADGVSALEQSGGTLRQAADALAEGAVALKDGARELADGMKRFDEEGIDELSDMADDALAELVTRVRALREADIGYDNFGGIAEGRTGSVRFIIETDGIG